MVRYDQRTITTKILKLDQKRFYEIINNGDYRKKNLLPDNKNVNGFFFSEIYSNHNENKDDAECLLEMIYKIVCHKTDRNSHFSEGSK